MYNVRNQLKSICNRTHIMYNVKNQLKSICNRTHIMYTVKNQLKSIYLSMHNNAFFGTCLTHNAQC